MLVTALCDQLSQKLGNMGQNVSQQAKNFAEVTRINAQIVEKKQQISKLYIKIGQSYYEMHRDDPYTEEAESIAQISRLYSEIESLDAKITQIKGTVRCSNCGADVPAGSVFCSVCGSKVLKPKQEDDIDTFTGICPVCRHPHREGDFFCNNCGTKLDESNTGEEETIESETSEQE